MKRNSSPKFPAEISPDQAIPLIRKQIEKAETTLARGSYPTSDEASAWELLTKNILEKAFGKASSNVTSVMEAGRMYFATSDTDFDRERANALRSKVARLYPLIELLETERQLSSGESITAAPLPTGHRIFLVHGHDETSLSDVARFLEKLGQKVIILREQPNKGRTIIEKFEDYADVGFAVVLLTPDDEGKPRSSKTLQSRARQNVILELGFFIGRLGRSRVCPLYGEGVEIPSDYAGVAYTKLDPHGAWRIELAKELKAAGFPIDMNLAFQSG